MESKALENKVCLVTGASGGLSSATALLFASKGATVYLADLSAVEGARVALEIGPAAKFVELDVTDESNWIQVMDLIDGECGRLDVLVNCAGATGVVAEDRLMDTQLWRRMFDINSTGPFLGMKHGWPLLRKSDAGSVVNISSISGSVVITGAHPGYGAAKGALTTLSRIMAVEMADDRIRVNSIAPGVLPVMSSMSRSAGGEEKSQSASEADISSARAKRDVGAKVNVPLRRVGRYDEVTQAILFLASPTTASYVTGTELRVDGGFTAQ